MRPRRSGLNPTPHPASASCCILEAHNGQLLDAVEHHHAVLPKFHFLHNANALIFNHYISTTPLTLTEMLNNNLFSLSGSLTSTATWQTAINGFIILSFVKSDLILVAENFANKSL